MKYALIVLPFLAAAAWGQDDIYKSLALGDRVQITFRSGGTINGNLEPNPMGRKPKAKGDTTAEPPVDYTKAESLTVNLSWEYPGLDGTMTVLKKEIKNLRKLQRLDQETMERLKKQKEEIRKDLERQNEQLKAESVRRAKEAEEERLRLEKVKRSEAELSGKEADVTMKLEKLKKGLELLKEFPPEQGWGPEKLKEISGKAGRKQPVPPTESRFIENYTEWAAAKAAQDETNKSTPKKETPPEEKKP